MIRRKQRAHDVAKLVAAQYGYLVSFTGEQYQEGEQWDVSYAMGKLAEALVKESEKPKKDFGELVRQRRKQRGLPVPPRPPLLPEPSAASPERQVMPPLVPDIGEESPHDLESQARLRAQLAEFRVAQSYRALEEAERHDRPRAEVDRLEVTYVQELATYTAGTAATAARTHVAPDRLADEQVTM